MSLALPVLLSSRGVWRLAAREDLLSIRPPTRYVTRRLFLSSTKVNIHVKHNPHIWEFPFTYLVSTRDKLIQFKILHRAHFFLYGLHKMSLTISPACWLCMHQSSHYLYNTIVNPSWAQILPAGAYWKIWHLQCQWGLPSVSFYSMPERPLP